MKMSYSEKKMFTKINMCILYFKKFKLRTCVTFHTLTEFKYQEINDVKPYCT